jgi:acyl dehydratase
MDVKEKKMGVNYGLNKLRFNSAEIEEIQRGVQATFNLQFEVEGKEKPAGVAEAVYRSCA